MEGEDGGAAGNVVECRGAIYVWASGNGGNHGDDCNCDGYSSRCAQETLHHRHQDHDDHDDDDDLQHVYFECEFCQPARGGHLVWRVLSIHTDLNI